MINAKSFEYIQYKNTFIQYYFPSNLRGTILSL